MFNMGIGKLDFLRYETWRSSFRLKYIRADTIYFHRTKYIVLKANSPLLSSSAVVFQ